MKKFTYKITAKNKNKLVFFLLCVQFEKHLCASRPTVCTPRRRKNISNFFRCFCTF